MATAARIVGPDPKRPGNVLVEMNDAKKTKVSRPPNDPDVMRLGGGGSAGASGGIPTQFPDDIFNGNPQQKVQEMASNIVDYDKYVRQFAMEDYDTAKTRLDENFNRYMTLSKEAEKTGMQDRSRNYDTSLRRAGTGYLQRGIMTPGKSGIIANQGREMREGYTEDVDLFKRGLEIQREDQKTTYDRTRQDIETGQRRSTVNELSAISNQLYQGV